MQAAETEYQLGSAASERERLIHQGSVLAPATRMMLEAAGIRPGMRVLDLGSGIGDVAFIAVELVGSSGEIVGIDQSSESVAQANSRAREQGAGNVSFFVGDIRHAAAGGGPFDAIIGRLVLMYVSDPAAVLRAQASVLRPEGVVAPIEFELPSARSIPSTPLASEALLWLGQAFKRAGIEGALGPRLWTVLQEAGLRPQGMIGVQPHLDAGDGAASLAGIVRTALPLIERAGAASAEEVHTETLEQRLKDELDAVGGVFAHPTLFSAWGTATRAT
jgi:ubiquinone/menaquinone biosynthesis C-methylase UbiE